MATSVTALSGTIPAGTPKSAPHTVALSLGPFYTNMIRWRVPPGPRGNLGWYLAMGGVQVLPQNAGSFIVADDEHDEWEIEGLPDSGAWQLVGYNTGTYDHTVYLDFHTTPVAGGATLTGFTGNGFPLTEADIPTMWL